MRERGRVEEFVARVGAMLGCAILLSFAGTVFAAPTVSLTAPANGARYHAPANVTITASASAPSGTSVARVEFYAGTVLVGTALTSPYTVTWSNAAAATYSLTAKAFDNLGAFTTSAARSITVSTTNNPPTVSINPPTNNSSYLNPASVAITAAATAPEVNGSVTQVEFFVDGVRIGTDTASPYNATWASPTPGAHTVTARATDQLGVQTSATVNVSINTTNTAPTVSVSAPAANSNYPAPASFTITAAAGGPELNDPITKVEFFANGGLINTDTTSPFSYTWSNVPVGSYSLTARATDSHGAVTTSSARMVIVSAKLTAYYVHTDQLDTPRVITNSAGTAVWRWDNLDPFGANAANENPSGLGTFTCNLRLPGQYFDKETNLHYNYFRDYDPSIGRYVQSDPIGLRGGVNTYAYVGNNPISKFDPFGLDETVWMPGRGRSIADGPRNGNWCGGNWSGGQVPSLNRGQDGPRGPVDSLDRCCMVHDRCYAQCDRYPEKNVREACLINCDRGLVRCLRNLNDDCTRWPEPPRPRTESDSQWYRDDALRYFDERIRRWEANNRPR